MEPNPDYDPTVKPIQKERTENREKRWIEHQGWIGLVFTPGVLGVAALLEAAHGELLSPSVLTFS